MFQQNDVDYLTKKALFMGKSPICKKCGKAVTVQITNGEITYYCHGKSESHPDLEGFRHPEKAF